MSNNTELKGWGDFLVTGILMAIVGLLMIIFQSESLDLILTIFGILLLIGGVINAFMGIRSGDSPAIVSGAVKIVLGLAMIIVTNLVSDILMAILAIGLIIVGISNVLTGIKAGLDASERILPIVVGAAFLIVGLYAIMNLNETADFVMIVIGIVTLIGGVLDIYSAIRLKTM